MLLHTASPMLTAQKRRGKAVWLPATVADNRKDFLNGLPD